MPIRGNPRALMLVFFAFALFFTGALYETGNRALSSGDPISLSTVAALGAGLGFVLIIVGRILWLTSARPAVQS